MEEVICVRELATLQLREEQDLMVARCVAGVEAHLDLKRTRARAVAGRMRVDWLKEHFHLRVCVRACASIDQSVCLSVSGQSIVV